MLFKSWLLPSVCLGVEQNDDPSKHQCHSVTVSATVTCCLAVFWVRVFSTPPACFTLCITLVSITRVSFVGECIQNLVLREAWILDHGLVCTSGGAQKSSLCRVCGMLPHELSATSCSALYTLYASAQKHGLTIAPTYGDFFWLFPFSRLISLF